ncbi:uncharacterized protein EI97DRAFT_454330 [Westerdykella ornata]|uniref:Uncharacterized protein n=1 Tax=Westerdykella ornata TaxID=318751 RepID=A0A6A6JYE1_WESOR|nr:uncharacterized protein EI97DRAFT_454330 [Westerdykella ornata]KAF2281113.1 hypothetical protein EI97DRAFT_454330 [Westerdykella ornata]
MSSNQSTIQALIPRSRLEILGINGRFTALPQRIIDAIQHRFGRHINLDEEELLDLAEKLEFITSHMRRRATPRAPNVPPPRVTVFIVRVRSAYGTRVALVYGTKVIVETLVLGNRQDHKTLFEDFCEAVDEMANIVIEDCSVLRRNYY